MSRRIARVAWLIPAALLLLSLNQVRVASGLAATLEEGEATYAEVLRYFRSDRKDVTHAEVDLRATLSDGTVRTWEKLSLPYSIAHRIDAADSVAVRISPGAAQEVAIVEIAGTQSRIARYNAAMSFVVFLLALVGVWAWNRHESRAPNVPTVSELPASA